MRPAPTTSPRTVPVLATRAGMTRHLNSYSEPLGELRQPLQPLADGRTLRYATKNTSESRPSQFLSAQNARICSFTHQPEHDRRAAQIGRDVARRPRQ